MGTGTAMSDKMEQDLLYRWLKNTTTILGAPPATLYVGLGTAGDDTGLTEPQSTNSYTRQSLTFGASNATMTGTNPFQLTGPTIAVQYAQATNQNWGTISHFGIYDAQTSGNLLFWGALGSNVTININDRFEFAAGAISITAD